MTDDKNICENSILNTLNNNNNNVLIFDIETTGLPKCKGFNNYYNPCETIYYDNSRMIELGYIICSADGIVIKEVEHLIKPDNFSINNSEIHGISNIDAIKNGLDIKDVLNIFHKDIENINTIVAHNINFDYNILLSECYRYFGMNHNIITDIMSKHQICTMKLGKEYLSLNKFPKLIDLHKHLFNKEIVQNHRALSDVKLCAECYYRMKI